MGFDEIQKARHYNSHPCGIEVKEVVRLVGFNLGSVFKYVVRRHGKEKLKSLQKAKFYLEDNIKHIQWAVPTIRLELAVSLVGLFAMAEENWFDFQFYEKFAALLQYPDVQHHEAVLDIIQKLIDFEQTNL